MVLALEWDDWKADQNARKHGIDFDDAARVWNDELRVEWIDDREDYGEDRWVTVGETAEGMITVVYTVRRGAEGEAIRIISAWPSTVSERRQYFERPGV